MTIELQFGKEWHTLLCILKLVTNRTVPTNSKVFFGRGNIVNALDFATFAPGHYVSVTTVYAHLAIQA